MRDESDNPITHKSGQDDTFQQTLRITSYTPIHSLNEIPSPTYPYVKPFYRQRHKLPSILCSNPWHPERSAALNDFVVQARLQCVCHRED